VVAATLTRSAKHFRFSSNSGHVAAPHEPTRRARNGHLPMTWRRASRWLVQSCGTLLRIGKLRALPPNLQRILAALTCDLSVTRRRNRHVSKCKRPMAIAAHGARLISSIRQQSHHAVGSGA
jgi:hypothetical protein